MPNNNQTIIIAGSPRTGTTLLGNAVCSSPSTNQLLKEAHYLNGLVNTYNRGLQDFNGPQESHYFSTQEQLKSFTARWLTNFLDIVKEGFPQAEILALKSVWLTPLLPVLYELNPNCRFVVSVRDPRDVICSMLEIGKKQQSKGLPTQYPRDIDYLCKNYNNSYNSLLAARSEEFHQQLLFVKYEDFVTRPDQVIPALETFLDITLSFDPGADWNSSARDFEKDRKSGDPYITQLYGKQVLDTQVGRYKKDLRDAEAHRVENLCAQIIERFNY